MDKSIVLQKILFSNKCGSVVQELYYRCDINVREDEQGYLYLPVNSLVNFNTYYNSFSCSKWKRYTSVKELSLYLEYIGELEVTIIHEVISQGLGEDIKIHKTVLYKSVLSSKQEKSSTNIGLGVMPADGMITFCVKGLSVRTVIYNGAYCGMTDKENDKVRPALIFCTYNRPKKIIRNIDAIIGLDSIIQAEIFVIDNAQNLNEEDVENKENIHLLQNRNAGGSGGFARGMIEALRYGVFTHCILMDDDIIVDPRVIERWYMFVSCLKYEYRDHIIGGAMFRTDIPYIQVESGACWNKGEIKSCKHMKDMRDPYEILLNEEEEQTDYNAWWFCAIPMKYIREDNLPLPLFYCNDDVEYGIRCNDERKINNDNNVILLNGLCVWHDPFDSKLSASRFYYIHRNRLIVNAVHNMSGGWKEDFKYISEKVRLSYLMYRYEEAECIIQGVHDFLKGAEYLMGIDPEEKNNEITMKNRINHNLMDDGITVDYSWYRLCCTIEDCDALHRMVRKITNNGLMLLADRTIILPPYANRIVQAYRAEKIIYYDEITGKGYVSVKNMKRIRKIRKELRILKHIWKKQYLIAIQSYKEKYAKLKSISFWLEYLNQSSNTSNALSEDNIQNRKLDF